MTSKEAIKAIRCNYPPSSYSMLREALDLALELLEQQDKESSVYKLILLDDTMRAPNDIDSLLFSTYDKARSYMRENNLREDWWAIGEIQLL